VDVPREPSGYERYHEARARGDVDAMTTIALDLAAQAQFNLQPGSLPELPARPARPDATARPYAGRVRARPDLVVCR
jgi:hypothetical protein